MSSYFGSGYWSQKYWTVNYFLGGELPEGGMQAVIAGGASVTAELTSIGAPVSSGGGGRTAPTWTMRVYVNTAIPVNVHAWIAGRSKVRATARGAAMGAARINAESRMTGTATSIDWYASDANFWLVAA